MSPHIVANDHLTIDDVFLIFFVDNVEISDFLSDFQTLCKWKYSRR